MSYTYFLCLNEASHFFECKFSKINYRPSSVPHSISLWRIGPPSMSGKSHIHNGNLPSIFKTHQAPVALGVSWSIDGRTTIVTISVQPGLMPLLKSGGQYQFSTWCPPPDAILLNSYFLYFCTSTILRACFVAPLIIFHTCVPFFWYPAPPSQYPSWVCYIDPLSTLLPLLET